MTKANVKFSYPWVFLNDIFKLFLKVCATFLFLLLTFPPKEEGFELAPFHVYELEAKMMPLNHCQGPFAFNLRPHRSFLKQASMETCFGRGAVWPDEAIKIKQKFPKSCPKSSHIRLYSDNSTSQMVRKVSRYFSYYCRKICHQDLSKIIQSDHTGQENVSSSSLLSWQNEIWFARFLLTWKVPFRPTVHADARPGNWMIRRYFQTLPDFRIRCCWPLTSDCSDGCTTAISWTELRRAFCVSFWGWLSLGVAATKRSCALAEYRRSKIFFYFARLAKKKISEKRKKAIFTKLFSIH